MVREINGLGVMPSNTGSAGKAAKKPEDTATSSPASARPETTGDEVQLSAEARSIQSLADKVTNLPAANLERAEKIKVALESGDYQIDDLVLADKIINTESLLN